MPIIGNWLDFTFNQGWSESQLQLTDSFISSEVQFMYVNEVGSKTSFRFVGTFTISNFCPSWLDSLQGAINIIAGMGSSGSNVASILNNLLDDVKWLCGGGSITMKFSTNGGEIDLQNTSLTVSGKEITLQDLKDFLGFWDLKNGAGCLADAQCLSDRCDKYLTCQPKLKDGEGYCSGDNDCVDGVKCTWALTCGKECTWDSQCSTGRCSKRLICEPKLNNGGSCGEDEECKSGRCAKSFRCENKLGKNQYCLFDTDCQSNKCKLDFWSGWYTCQ